MLTETSGSVAGEEGCDRPTSKAVPPSVVNFRHWLSRPRRPRAAATAEAEP